MSQPRCSERAYGKLRWLLAQAPESSNPAEACRALVAALRARLQQWPLPPERSIDRIEATDGDSYVLIEGYHHATMRLFVSVVIKPDRRSAEIILILTKGDLSIDAPTFAFGDRGEFVGNSILTAMLLDVGICVLRRHGVRVLTNHPADQYLRHYYAMLGFANGEILDLYDEPSLAKAFDAIDQAYSRFGFALVNEE